MRYEVSDEAKRRATRCPFEFQCLRDGTCGGSPMCEVVSDLQPERILFVTPHDRSVSCQCRIEFGLGVICQCPVRREIYERYGV